MLENVQIIQENGQNKFAVIYSQMLKNSKIIWITFIFRR